MLARLFLLFTITTLVEMVLLIELGKWMGLLPTLALVIATGIAGAWLARREGTRAIRTIQQQAAQGQVPTDGLLDGLAVLIAGAFLLTPGILTDIAGFLLLIPAARTPMKIAVKRQVEAGIRRGVADGSVRVNIGGMSMGMPPRASTPPPRRADGVIEGELVD